MWRADKSPRCRFPGPVSITELNVRRAQPRVRAHKHTNRGHSREDYFPFTVEINETTPSLNLMPIPSTKTGRAWKFGCRCTCRRLYRLPLVTQRVDSQPPPPIQNTLSPLHIHAPPASLHSAAHLSLYSTPPLLSFSALFPRSLYCSGSCSIFKVSAGHCARACVCVCQKQ